MDTGDGGRFFQENHRFPTSSCSFLRFSRFVDLGFTGWSVHSISVRLIRYKSLVVIEQAGHSVASVVTATNPLSCPLGPAVTCRCGTCFHLPGYCRDWISRERVSTRRHRPTSDSQKTVTDRTPLLLLRTADSYPCSIHFKERDEGQKAGCSNVRLT